MASGRRRYDRAMPKTELSAPPASCSPQPTEREKTTLVLRRFRVVFNAVRSHFQQVESQAGLGGAQIWALSVVRDRPGIGVSGLAAAMDIHQSTASNLVRAMLKRELIQAVKGLTDRRSIELSILPAGLEVLGRVSGPFEGVLPTALAQLPPQTLDRLEEDLRALIAVLHADETAEQTPLAHL